MTTTPTTPTNLLPFEADAVAVVRAVRAAFSEILTGAGADPHDPQSIGRVVGLNKNLAWKVSKIVQADDPSVALEQMPGAAGLKIFLDSLERSGAAPGHLAGARRAVDDYERLIRVHSGDRQTLEMMMTELSPSGRRERDEQHRKLLFQGGSYVWGVQTRVNLKIGLVGPSSRQGCLDFASVNGLIDFRRIRPDVTWTMASRRSRNDDGSEMATAASEPIDAAFSGPEHAPLMGEFCSRPLPELRRLVDGTTTTFELVEGPVGNTGALTCVVGAIQRCIPYFRTPENRWGEHSALCDIPSELLVLDVFLHRSFTFAMHPEAFLYSELRASYPYASPGRERNRLPLNEPIQSLGAGPLPLATPEVPRYNQMVQAAFAHGLEVGGFLRIPDEGSLPGLPDRAGAAVRVARGEVAAARAR
ncbi:MAG: hypothetical protein IPJ41_15775 [Phycisphaerales bacterium]|nr:hypothetical protein [Phycisphaerales bacterium]